MKRLLCSGAAMFACAYTLGLVCLSPSTAEAKYRRVTAVTSCNADDDFTYSTAFYDPSGGYSPGFSYVQAISKTISRGTNGLLVNAPNTPLRCSVPTDSYFAHQTMTEAHVSGTKNAGNGFASYVKACYTSPWTGLYFCGASHYVASGSFNEVIPLGSIWSDADMLPMITAVLAYGDKLYGVYYTDS